MCVCVCVCVSVMLHEVKCDGHSDPPQKPQLARGETIDGILLWVHQKARHDVAHQGLVSQP